MMWTVVYHHAVVEEDIPVLPKREKTRIKRAIEEKLVTHPEIFGKPLRKSLKGYRRLRVGDYRIVFKLQRSTVTILFIGHRSTVYEADTIGRIA